MNGMGHEMTALMIAPNRNLARQFHESAAKSRTFQILAEMKSYPAPAALEIRLRQLQPDVVLLDLSTDLDSAAKIIRAIASGHSGTQAVGLHVTNDLEAILRSLRIGAVEFLYAPFEPSALAQAASRIQRLFQPDSSARPQPGKVVMFSSAKPGSGASTLATQTAFALKRITGKRVLLADFDLMGGTVAFYLKLRAEHSLLDAVRQADRLDPLRWSSMVQQVRGVDVLPAPDVPGDDAVEPSRLQDILEYARLLYDWVLVDLPTVFQGISLLALSHSDRAVLVTTPELPSLHLTRKAVNLLEQLGFGKERFEVIVNRAGKGEGFGQQDMGRILNCPTATVLPNDYFCLHNALSLGQPPDAACEWEKTLQAFARRLAGVPEKEDARHSLWQKAKLIFAPAQTEVLHAANR